MNTTIVLADLRLAEPADLVSGWTSAVQRTVQKTDLARARNASQRDQGNVLVSYTFSVSRGHDTLAAAEDYIMDLPRAVGRAFGEFTAVRPVSGRTYKLLAASATYAPPAPVNGLRTLVTYTVTGALPPETT